MNAASATLLVQSLRDSAAATPVGGPALAAEIPEFSFRLREMMSGMTIIFLPPRIFHTLSEAACVWPVPQPQTRLDARRG